MKTNRFHLRHEYGRTCSAVRAVRSVFNVNMEDALAMVNGRGFVCTGKQAISVLRAYRDTPQQANNWHDWTVSNTIPDLTYEERS